MHLQTTINAAHSVENHASVQGIYLSLVLCASRTNAVCVCVCAREKCIPTIFLNFSLHYFAFSPGAARLEVENFITITNYAVILPLQIAFLHCINNNNAERAEHRESDLVSTEWMQIWDNAALAAYSCMAYFRMCGIASTAECTERE